MNNLYPFASDLHRLHKNTIKQHDWNEYHILQKATGRNISSLNLLMVREDCLKYREIVEILSITEGTVAQQMNHAIHKIVAIVKKQYPSLGIDRK
ncbi:MAG: sigma-70 region 4 domain-containing protein [Tannerella sp.]|nr:sigma-70 region 4 domain-containing protein [Tannerella sp.]